jgi:rhodanese-related sulfurtransferase
MIRQISAVELSQRLQQGDEFVVLDVREPGEIQVAALPDTLNIPMNQIPARAEDLPRDKDIVVMCHHGIRSMHVAGYLSRLGFESLYNLAGGIDAWSRDVDPKVPTY